MDKLASVLKAYSLYDPAVGYVQGMNLIAAPLLLYCSEEEAFSLLVKLMKDHDLRSLFLPEMPGLHTRLYQFDRLLEDYLPAVHIHLIRAGVTSSMYASQWFLTLFAYKFPISMVVRIYDVVVYEGLNSILQFGIALMQKNQETLLSKTKLEELLDYLKEGIFAVYQYEAIKSPGGGIFGSAQEPTYRVDEFVGDAMDVVLDPVKLKKYEADYVAVSDLQRTKDEERESLRQANITFQVKVRDLEKSLSILNQEHVELANELVASKMREATLEDENEALQSTVSELKVIVDAQPAEVEARFKDEMDQLINKTTATSVENQRIEDAMSEMEQQLIDLKMRYATEHQEHEILKRKMEGLKKSFNA